jgi:DNA-binding transcriptional LysR family regulator
MDTLTSLRAFRTVVELGSFVAAAERLELSTAMVSKHVTRTEQRLGVRLLNRNSRALSLTEEGRVYFERCRTILDDLEATELELGALGSAPRGTLRLTAPTWSAGQRLAALFAEYRRRYPEVVLDVSFEDRVVDLVQEGYDLALRVARNADSLSPLLIARPVCPATFYIAASGEYINRKGAPKSPEDLKHHDFVAAGSLNSLALVGPRGPFDVPVRVVLRCRSMAGVANAVAAGIGVAPVPAFLFDDPIFKGVLTPVLTEHALERTLYLVHASHKYVSPKMRTFVDFILESVSRFPERKREITEHRAAYASSLRSELR